MAKFWSILIAIMLAATTVLAGDFLLLGETELADAIKKEFVEQGVDEEIELEFFGGQTSFAIENSQQAKVLVSRLKYDADANKFSANAEIFADGKAYAKTTLSGRYFVMTEAWVPAQTIEKDTVIKENMLKKIPLRNTRLKAVMIQDKAKLVDMQAKKTLKEGKLVNEREVGPLVLIKKGKMVTSVYVSKGMQITAKAEALEDGVKGQNIEVMNTKSNRKFFAKVVDADTVEIQSGNE